MTTQGASIDLSIFPLSRAGFNLFLASLLFIKVNLAGQQLPDVGANFNRL